MSATEIIYNTLSTKISEIFDSQELNIHGSKRETIISNVANDVTNQIIQLASDLSSKQIEAAPGEVIGDHNPVDIVSSNLGPEELSENIYGMIHGEMEEEVNAMIMTSLENEISLHYANEPEVVNDFQAKSNDISREVGSLAHDVNKESVSLFSYALFFGIHPTIQILNNISSYFEGNPLTALSQITRENAKNLSAKYLGMAEQFDVNNEENLTKESKAQQGFHDPDSQFPKKEYENISETNKLAQGDVSSTIVVDKNKERAIGAKLPFGDSFDQPESPFKGKYPYNRVIETESGHVIEVDDTPGAERIHIFHRTGSFVEIDSNGSMVRRTKGSEYSIIDRNGKISIQGKADISVNGACNIFVGNNANIEVEGDTNIVCHNDITAQAGGKMNLSATEELNISSNRVNIQAYEDLNIKANNGLLHTADNLNVNVGNEHNNQSKNYNVRTERYRNQSSGASHIKASNNIHINPGRDLHLRCGNDYFLDADDYDVDENRSVSATDSKNSLVAVDSNVGILDGRKDILAVQLDDPSFINTKDEFSLLLEEEEPDSEDFNNTKNILVSAGITTSAELANTPVVLESDTGSSQQNIQLDGDNDLGNKSSLPGNYKLSPNFTLEMLSSKAAVSKYKIESRELTFGQIVLNLQRVALNILEPVYGIYPKVIVTSGYRHRGNSSKSSQHPLGKAVDIQFAGLPKGEYYNVACELVRVLNFDQFLLEYSSYSNNPWIHISYDGESNRKQVMTFWNHKKHSNGLVKLI